MRIFILILSTVCFLFACKSEPKKNAIQTTGDAIVDQINLDIQGDPDNAELLYKRGQIMYEKSEYEQAIGDLQKAISIDSLQPKYYHLLSDSHLDYYQSRKALDVMLKASRSFPDHVHTLLKLSELQLILNQYDNSIFTVNSVIGHDPQNAEGYFMLGMNFRAIGNLDKAINSFQTAVEFDPELIDAWIILGELHEEKGENDPMIYYNAALNVSPDNPRVLHSMAYYLQNHGDRSGALKKYRQINISSPDYTEAYLNAGLVYMDMDSLEQAFEQMNILAGREPQNPLPYYYRGLIHKAYGNYEAAQIDFQNAVNLAPDFEIATTELADVKNTLQSVQ